MTRLLFHSYHFPPIGGSGAQRPLKMAIHLDRLGYTPIVVTGAGATADRWAPRDDTLLREIPRALTIHRLAPSAHAETSSRWRGRVERWLAMRSAWARWWIASSAQLGVDAGKDVDLIYVWMQPYESAAAGAAISRALSRPWVADLGDPWALDEMMVYPSALHRKRELMRMRRSLSTASAIVMSTQEAARRLLQTFPELADRPVVAIPNGYDAADFAGTPPSRSGDRFRIVHTGYLHTELGFQHRRRLWFRRVLRGSRPGLDILTRSHVYLLQALDRLLRSDASIAERLEFHLAGVLTPIDEALARRSPVTRLHGYVSHAESISLMRGADLLFLPMQNLPPGVRATIVPGKTYEYLASRRPLLAAVPDGDARDILTAAGHARLCRPDDVAGLAAAIASALADHAAGHPPPSPNSEVVEQFEYGVLAAQLAGVFEEVLARPERRQ